jgi:hypothetical protein
VEILERATGESHEGTEGSVTLLWERGPEHIEYACVPLEAWEPMPPVERVRPAGHADDPGIPRPSPARDELGADTGPAEAAHDRSDDWPLRVPGAPAPPTAPGTPL